MSSGQTRAEIKSGCAQRSVIQKSGATKINLDFLLLNGQGGSLKSARFRLGWDRRGQNKFGV